MWPPDDTLHAAWETLVADPDTAAAFAEQVFALLKQALAARHPDADEADITTAAGDALLELFRNPSRFDPSKRGLRGYLLMAAEGDLSNLNSKERRHNRHRNPVDVVELDPPAWNEEESELPQWDAPEVQAALATLSPPERAVLELQRGGERDTPVFAAALGLSHLPAKEQADEVKRVKDRAMKRLQRALRVPI